MYLWYNLLIHSNLSKFYTFNATNVLKYCEIKGKYFSYYLKSYVNNKCFQSIFFQKI